MLAFTGLNWLAFFVATAVAFALDAIAGLGFIATAMASDSAFCAWGMPLYLIQSG